MIAAIAVVVPARSRWPRGAHPVRCPPADAEPPPPRRAAEAGDAPPAFAEEDFQPVQPLEAFEAATGVDLIEMAQDVGAVDGDPGSMPGKTRPQPRTARRSDRPVRRARRAGVPDRRADRPHRPRHRPDGSARSGRPGVLGSYTLEARMTAESAPLESGVIWRVFADDADADGKMRMVGEADGGPVTLKLKPGEYFVHAAFGRAGMTRKVTISETAARRDHGTQRRRHPPHRTCGEDRVIAPEEVRFDIYAPDESGSDGRVTVMENAPATTIIGLNAGTYHVVCHYGDANAIVRADIRVEAGKLTEATVYQQAARVTLKLVEGRGGEALANTAWSVVTPAGESVVESVGAFPSVVLSAGEYTAIATHEGKIFEQDFTVEAGPQSRRRSAAAVDPPIQAT